MDGEHKICSCEYPPVLHCACSQREDCVMVPLLAENARLLARVGDLESVGAALEDAGNRLYAYIIKSNASGKEGKSAFFDVLEDGLQASRDFHDAQKQWQALAAHAAGAGDDGEGKDG